MMIHLQSCTLSEIDTVLLQPRWPIGLNTSAAKALLSFVELEAWQSHAKVFLQKAQHHEHT